VKARSDHPGNTKAFATNFDSWASDFGQTKPREMSQTGGSDAPPPYPDQGSRLTWPGVWEIMSPRTSRRLTKPPFEKPNGERGKGRVPEIAVRIRTTAAICHDFAAVVRIAARNVSIDSLRAKQRCHDIPLLIFVIPPTSVNIGQKTRALPSARKRRVL
jgi:hypothetical protein